MTAGQHRQSAVASREARDAGLLPGAAPFLDREREFAELESAIGRAVVGHGGLVVLSGEAGIGKSRLVSEVAASVARQDGGEGEPVLRVVWGRCWDSGGAPSLWPWIGALRELSAERDPLELREELASAGPWIAHLVPELREQLPELEDAPQPDSEQARFVLFDAMASFIRRASARRPLLIVLEDIHAADHLSLLAMLFIARQLSETRTTIIATHREAQARGVGRNEALLSKLATEAHRISLSGLPPEELGRLVEHHRGASSDPDTVHALHRATGGNPFFADEVVRMLLSEDRLDAVDESKVIPLRIPTGVRDVIGQRLDALPEATQQVLQHAAVIGNQFGLAVLLQATARERAELLEALEPALEERLIDTVGGELTAFRFVHDLIRETAYARLAPLERARLHAAVGQALARRYAGATEIHVEELAHHFLASLPVGDPSVALDYAKRAADHAMERFATERAIRLYGAALEALDLLDGLSEEGRALRRSELLLGLGRARVRMADPSGRDTLREAVAAARAGGSAQALAEVALAFGAFGLSPGIVDRELTELLEEALAGIGPEDSKLRVRLLSGLARALYWSADTGQRMALIEEATSMARRLGSSETMAVALGYCISAIRGPDTVETEFGWIDEFLSLPDPPREISVLTRSTEIDLLLEQGAFSAADAAIDTLESHAERLRDLRAKGYVPVHRARRAIMEGRFEEAQRLIAEATAISKDFVDSTFPLTIGGARFALSLIQGRPAELESAVRPLAEALPDMHLWRAGLVVIHAAAGDLTEARRVFERLAAAGFEDIPRNTMWLITLSLLSEGCANLGDSERARQLRALLAPYAERVIVSPVSGYRGPVARYLGLLAHTMGDEAAAEDDLRAALELARSQRTPPMVATISIDLGAVLAARGEDAAAAALLEEAAALADRLGLTALADRANALREQLPGGAAGRRIVEPAGEPSDASLSREGEVWTFAFEGRAIRVRDSKGIRHLAVLLSQPGVEVHALDLVRGESPPEATDTASSTAAAMELTVEPAGAALGSALDAAAKAAYRRRLEDLREDLDEAERWGDPERASRAREEMQFIAAELAAAVGIGGRDRPQGSDAERARVNVTRALRGAIRRLAEEDPQLGAELETTVHTGLFCRHEPDLRRPVHWRVDVG